MIKLVELSLFVSPRENTNTNTKTISLKYWLQYCLTDIQEILKAQVLLGRLDSWLV